MPQSDFPAPPSSRRHPGRSYVFGCAVILIVVIGAFFIGNNYYGWVPSLILNGTGLANGAGLGELTAVTPKVAPLQGTLFMTLDKNGVRSFYRYNVYSKELGKIADLPKGDLAVPSESALSGDLATLAFVQGTPAGNRILFGYTSDNGKATEFVPGSTDKPTALDIRGLAFSKDSYYLAYAEGKPDDLPSDWRISTISDTNSPSVKVANGISPAFGQGHTLFFLGNDGIYVLDVDAQDNGPRLLVTLSDVRNTDVLGTSEDGSVLVLQDSVSGTASVFSVQYGDTFTLTPQSVLVMGSYDRLSVDPSDSYVLGRFESVSKDGSSESIPSGVALSGNVAVALLDLPGFDPKTVSIAGWYYVQ